MTVWLAILLGFVQGLCEFLPVSSSGNLLLLTHLFGVDEGALFFTLMLHIGTLVAVLIVYWKTVWNLVKHPFQRTVGMLLLATVPTVIIAILFKKVGPFEAFYTAAEAGDYLGVCFLLTSVILVLADVLARPREQQHKLKDVAVKDALIIGTMQGIAVLPGVSRSGSTIAGALFSGLNRKAAADFSFLMSIIAIVGGAVLEIPDAIESGIAGLNFFPVVVGMIVAGVTGYFAIRFMLMAVKKKKLWGFAIYTAVLGLFVIVMQLLGKW